jgi:hypothetical protein
VSENLAVFAVLLAFWYLHWWATAKLITKTWPPTGRTEWTLTIGYPIAAASVSFAVVWLVSK